MPPARTWSEIVMERAEIVFSPSRNSHNPSSSPKSGVFSPACLCVSFPGVWSRLHNVLCKLLHHLLFCMKAQVRSCPPKLFPSLLLQDSRRSITPLFSSPIPYEAQGPRGPPPIPPPSDLHFSILTELLRPKGEL